LRSHHLNPLLALSTGVAILTGCGQGTPKITVGSQSSTGNVIAAEIVAQHLEHRLGHKIQRRLGIGSGLNTYQELDAGRISLYPEYTGAIESEILKEPASPDPSVVWERTHSEMSRVAKMELFNPLGYDNPPLMVVPGAQGANISTLSDAAAASTKWKIGVSYDFQQHSDLVTAINSYHLPMAQAMRGMDASELFPSLMEGSVNMIAADSTDGHLASSDYRGLADDRHAFPPYQACLLVRQDVLASEPQLRGYLAELSGKFTTEMMRKLSAEVEIKHREVSDVAAEFLSQAGLK
jgi:osmoprotectant transport system substrate-binding protein